MEVAGTSRAKPGEQECGDHFVVCQGQTGTLIAVADGLGHGPEAARAATAACALVEQHCDDSLESLMRELHRGLAQTRGAAVTLLRACPATGELHHAAVGNVEVACLGRDTVRPVCVPGIVGSNLRKVVSRTFPVSEGDLVVVHTDGISRRFELESYRHFGVRQLAEALIAEWGKDHDDATCVAVRF